MTDIVQKLKQSYHLDTVQPEHPVLRAVREIERLRESEQKFMQLAAEARRDADALRRDGACPHIRSTSEGTHHCALAAAPQPKQEPVAWCPDVCPITGLPFFMWIEHHETGQKVPTYGGPYDSYTIPVRDKDGSYCRERYDHDLGGWLTDEVEDVGVQIVSDQAYVSDEPSQPAQEPVAWHYPTIGIRWGRVPPDREYKWQPLYTTPQPAPVEQWIACSERMPEPGVEVLVWLEEAPVDGASHVTFDCWDEQRESPVSWSSATISVGLGWDSGTDWDGITHWMPLPKPPGSKAPQPAPDDRETWGIPHASTIRCLRAAEDRIRAGDDPADVFADFGWAMVRNELRCSEVLRRAGHSVSGMCLECGKGPCLLRAPAPDALREAAKAALALISEAEDREDWNEYAQRVDKARDALRAALEGK